MNQPAIRLIPVATNAGLVGMPLSVRLHFGRAAVQTIANRSGIDLLHIKGDAVDPSVRPFASAGSDVDVMVRPDQVDTFDGVLRQNEWRIYSTFELGSPFGHAQTYHHPLWGYLDVHRLFPGINLPPADAFARLWEERSSLEFAGVSCPVPSTAAQAAILVLNAARAGAGESRDVRRLWTDASSDQLALLEAEIDALDARLACDAALGGLESHKGEREYALWRAVSQGGTRGEEWWGRLLAQPTLAGRLNIIVRAPLVNAEHLGHQLGHAPSALEILREFFARPLRGVREFAGHKRGMSR